MDQCEDGFNGFYYSEDLENIAEYPNKYKEPFKKDKYYYHVSLFHIGENPSLKHETENAFLVQCGDKLFWVPKKLLKMDKWFKVDRIDEWKIHKSFIRTYIQ